MLDVLRSIHRKLGIKYRFDRCIHYVRRFGIGGAAATHRRIWSKTGGLQDVDIPGLPHPVTVRCGTADASTLEKIFVWNDYDLDYPGGVTTVIDAGANIGLSAIYFAMRFPDAQVVAIEPQSENFRLLERNTAHYPRVVPLRAALWSDDTTLGLSNPDDRVDSYQYSPDAGQQMVPALKLSSVLSRFGMSHIDVLKIDIEGAETAVFAQTPAWIDRVRMFIIELHSAEAREAFAKATSALAAVRYRHGEDDIVKVQ
jgi:FkbM family methyltransferase